MLKRNSDLFKKRLTDCGTLSKILDFGEQTCHSMMDDSCRFIPVCAHLCVLKNGQDAVHCMGSSASSTETGIVMHSELILA